MADLAHRTAWTLPVPGVLRTGGIALNRGPANLGLLAVHAVTHVVVYEFLAAGPLTELGRVAIAGASSIFGPYYPIAWGGSGERLYAQSGGGFAVIEVTDGGRQLKRVRSIAGCRQGQGAIPNDIVTTNGFIPPPHTATPTPSPTPTQPPTATLLPPSVTPSPTSEPSATSTATPFSGPIYLPISLSERCSPLARRVDVVLVLDASTSMLDEVYAGATKMRLSLQAAGHFLSLLGPDDHAAIVSFNATATLHQHLTGDKALLEHAMDSIANAGLTRIDLGLAVARAEHATPRRRATAAPVIVLLTDGKANPVGPDVAVAEAAAAKAAGVTVFAIGLGRPDDLDGWALTQIASRPEYYYETPDAGNLAAIYEEIAEEIPCPATEFWGRR